jgi:hypothetical protein
VFLISEIELPKNEDPAAFAEFIEAEYMPGVHMGPTRTGQVQELKLLREAATGLAEGDEGEKERGQRFLLVVDWAGMEGHSEGVGGVDEAVIRERFGATVENRADWVEVARRALSG